MATAIVPGLPRSPTTVLLITWPKAVIFFLWSHDHSKLSRSLWMDVEAPTYPALALHFVLSYDLCWLPRDPCIRQEIGWVCLNQAGLVRHLLIPSYSIKLRCLLTYKYMSICKNYVFVLNFIPMNACWRMNWGNYCKLTHKFLCCCFNIP